MPPSLPVPDSFPAEKNGRTYTVKYALVERAADLFIFDFFYLSKLTTSDIDNDVVGFFNYYFFNSFFSFFLSLSIAHDAIVGAFKLQFLLASKISFVFCFAKATLLIMQ